jgi:hypothetical protein
MNLAELLQLAPGMTDAELKAFALILTPELQATLAAVQAALGPRRHVVAPLLLTDGNYMLRADLLTEIGSGGLYHAGFGQLPPAALPLVEVIPWVDALALLPEQEGE